MGGGWLGGGDVCFLQGQKEGFRQQVLSVSNTGDQQGSGTLPKAADTELGLEARTFSQFISLKIGTVPNGPAPTSIIWTSLLQPQFLFQIESKYQQHQKSRFETSIKLALIAL